ncbi:hypothetical protein RN001_013245 [Aquatica leii]|uniref:Uncharacterized protein n=1 Tax=Aquatica leii TaxID=1421715 RepID=A0AAN7SNN3_9COLE|nr:hypothetical protein RN001_013245 [Aquatica leii]
MDNIYSPTAQPNQFSSLFIPVVPMSANLPMSALRRRKREAFLRKQQRRILIRTGPGTFTRMKRTTAMEMGIIPPNDTVTYEVSFVMPSQQRRKTESERLLNITARLPNGEVGNVFELNVHNQSEHWYCNVCQCAVVGLVFIHEIEPTHITNMQNAGSCALGSELLQVVSSGSAPPEIEGEIEKVAQIQAILDRYTASSLIGLEYLIELVQHQQVNEYLCLLCDKRTIFNGAIEHTKSYKHILRYLQLHFPKCFNALKPYTTKRNRRNWQPLLRKIVAAIENKFGRLKPLAVDVNTFIGKRLYFQNLVSNGIHLSEQNGITFEELVDVKLLTANITDDSATILIKPSDDVSKPFQPTTKPEPGLETHITTKPAAYPKPNRIILTTIEKPKRSFSPITTANSKNLETLTTEKPNCSSFMPVTTNLEILTTEQHCSLPYVPGIPSSDPTPSAFPEQIYKYEKFQPHKLVPNLHILAGGHREVHLDYNESYLEPLFETNISKSGEIDEFKMHNFEIKVENDASIQGLSSPEPINSNITINTTLSEVIEVKLEASSDRDSDIIVIEDEDTIGTEHSCLPCKTEVLTLPISKKKSHELLGNLTEKPPIDKSKDHRSRSNSHERDWRRKGISRGYRSRSNSRDKYSGRNVRSKEYRSRSNSLEKDWRRKGISRGYRSRSNSPEKDWHRKGIRRGYRSRSTSRDKDSGRIVKRSNSREKEWRRKGIRMGYRSRSNSRENDWRRKDISRGYRSRSNSRDKDSGRIIKSKEYRSRSNSREIDWRRKGISRGYRGRSNSRKREECRSRSNSREKDLDRKGKSKEYRPRSNSREKYWRRKSKSRDREYNRDRDSYRKTEPPHITRDRKVPLVNPRLSSPHVKTKESDSDVNIVGILRLLTALEEKLGSLGPKVIDLFAQALKMEKTKVNSSKSLLDETNCILFETIQEKFKEQLLVGLVDDNQKKAFKTAIQKITTLLNRDSGERKKQLKKVKPTVASGTGTVDKAVVAKQISTAFAVQGKSASPAEVERLTNAVVAPAEASKNTDKPTRTETTASKPESGTGMDGLSDLDLQALLYNFNDLCATEQRNLTSYLKKLELKEPERVDRLKKIVMLYTEKRQKLAQASAHSSRDSNCLQATNLTVEKVEKSEVVTVTLDSDQNNCTFKDVFKMTKQNGKNNEERERKDKVPVFKTKDFDSLITNIIGNFKSRNESANLLGVRASSSSTSTIKSEKKYSTVTNSLNIRSNIRSRIEFNSEFDLRHKLDRNSRNYRPQHDRYVTPSDHHQRF